MCLAVQALVLTMLRSLNVADLITDDGMNEVGALKQAQSLTRSGSKIYESQLEI